MPLQCVIFLYLLKTSLETAEAALHPDDHNGSCAPDLGTGDSLSSPTF